MTEKKKAPQKIDTLLIQDCTFIGAQVSEQQLEAVSKLSDVLIANVEAVKVLASALKAENHGHSLLTVTTPDNA